jgi:3-polyprenyl-4-hydroxybenzoate decarboxylase
MPVLVSINKNIGHAHRCLRLVDPLSLFAKWIVVTDEDIDIRDPFMQSGTSWRVEPQKGIFFIPNTS